MRRREFITLLGGAAATWPLTVRAQQGERMRRIGLLTNGLETDAETVARVAALRKGLQELGWGPSNLQIDIRHGLDIDELRARAKELVGLAPDVVMAGGPPSVMALLKVSRTVPIVFAAVTDPVGLGIVQDLARPGGNATGFLTSEFGFGAKLLELLREIAPSIRRVVILANLDNPSAAPQFAAIQTVASSVGARRRRDGTRARRFCTFFERRSNRAGERIGGSSPQGDHRSGGPTQTSRSVL